MARAIPLNLVARLALAIGLDSAVQIIWKVAAMQLPHSAPLPSTVEAALHQPIFLLVAALFAWQLVNWLKVLERSDLSYAQPITSLSFVSVFALSALFLGEHVDAPKALGIALVIVGVWLISGTHHDSRAGNAGTQ